VAAGAAAAGGVGAAKALVVIAMSATMQAKRVTVTDSLWGAETTGGF
jgi:hypothetical protein